MVVTLPMLGEEIDKSDWPAERCELCKHFGRTVDMALSPSGQCCKRAPGSYTVTHRDMLPIAGSDHKRKWHVLRTKDVSCSFPPVWPTDHCGEFEKASTEAA